MRLCSFSSIPRAIGPRLDVVKAANGRMTVMATRTVMRISYYDHISVMSH